MASVHLGVRSLVIAAALLGSFFLVGRPVVGTSGDSSGIGTCFEVADSTYLNVTLCSVEVVNVSLESVPYMVDYTVRAVGEASSTMITIVGFVPGRTYYRHQDGFLQESFVPDDGGSYVFNQDLVRPHHVLIAEETSTFYLRVDATGGDCTKFGTWDSNTNTCTMTKDANDSVVVDGDGITLDGAGHTIATCCGWAIYVSSRSGFTAKNVKSTAFDGVFFFSSSGNTITGSSFMANQFGVYLSSASSTVITGNTFTGNVGYDSRGFHLTYATGNTLTGNTFTKAGMFMEYSNSNTVGQNNIDRGAYMRYSHGNTLTGNLWPQATGGQTGGGVLFRVDDCNGNTFKGNRITTDAWWALILRASHGNSIRNNEIRAAAQSLVLENTNDNAVEGNYLVYGGWGTVSVLGHRNTLNTNTITNGIGISGDDNTLSGNAIYATTSVGGTRNLVTANSMTGTPPYAALSLGGTYNTASGNTIRTTGVVLGGSHNTVSENTILDGSVTMYFTDWHTVKDNTISGSGGIAVTYSGRETITGNKISVSGTAISLWGSCCGTVIHGNTITGGYGGISLYYYSQFNTVTENTVTDAAVYGILLGFGSGTNLVARNKVTGGTFGILMGADSITAEYNTITKAHIGIQGDYYTFNGVIRGNLVKENTYGIRLYNAFNYLIYHNCIINNVYQTQPFGSARWHDAVSHPPFGRNWGNHWSDYTGQDLDGDGVGDTKLPHQGVDSSPLMLPSMANFGRVCSGNSAPTIVSFSATHVAEGMATTFTASASDPENDPLSYTWDFNGDNIVDKTTSANTATFVWGDDHAGTARVYVTDGDQTVSATTSVVVDNANPTLDATDGPVTEGQPLAVSFRAMDAGSDDLIVRINWGDGNTDELSFPLGPTPDPDESTDVNPRDVTGQFTRTFGDDTTMTATLTVSDDDGGTAVKIVSIQVVNGEPKITMFDVSGGTEGSPVPFSARATDPGTDPLTFFWTWDDGTSESRTYPNDGTFPFTAMDSGTHTWGDNAAFQVQLEVTDDDGGSTKWTQAVPIANVAPSLGLLLDEPSYLEGSPVTALANFEDPGTDDVNLDWRWASGPTRSITFYNNGVNPDPLKSPAGVRPLTGSDSMGHTYVDNGVFPLKVTACDDDGGCTLMTVSVLVYNVDPTASITGPEPGTLVRVGDPVMLTGSFTDPGAGDTHVAQWKFDSTIIDGTVTESGGSGTVTDTYTFTSPGVYEITLTVVDDDGGIGTANSVGEVKAFVVVYDPEGGFVTGGGWFTSPPGAYVPNPLLTGKATFGFVAKYQKGATVPEGQTEFQFRVGDFDFHSTSYEWLVIAGPKAMFKGSGTVNGGGQYGFLISAIDGDLPGGGGADRFRIKIWHMLSGEVVYDNQMGDDENADPSTVIGGGSIVIHKG